MKIILLEDVKNQGKKGQIINVKDGYGSYLINNKQAVLETKGSKKVLDDQNRQACEEEKRHLEDCQKLKQKIDQLNLIFRVKTGNQDQVFGTVSTKQIVTKLKDNNIIIDKHQIKLSNPINTLGTTVVDIHLHKNVLGQLKITLEK